MKNMKSEMIVHLIALKMIAGFLLAMKIIYNKTVSTVAAKNEGVRNP
jgi:hypothetical protein